jgi:hypothetical protein
MLNLREDSSKGIPTTLNKNDNIFTPAGLYRGVLTGS